jgi:hypothetical protein
MIVPATRLWHSGSGSARHSLTSMPHDYALHTELEVTCLCCGSLQPFTFASASDQLVCSHCRTHLGDEKAVRRDRDHIALWSAIWEHERDARAEAVRQAATDAAAADTARSALEAKVAELSATVIGQFDAVPASGVREELQSDLVRRAERATELSNRRNDRMMAVLWRLGRLHHAAGAGRCACGKPITECPEYRVLSAEEQALREWESKNVALAEAGSRHALPAEHPAVAASGTAGTGGPQASVRPSRPERQRPQARSDRR